MKNKDIIAMYKKYVNRLFILFFSNTSYKSRTSLVFIVKSNSTDSTNTR